MAKQIDCAYNRDKVAYNVRLYSNPDGTFTLGFVDVFKPASDIRKATQGGGTWKRDNRTKFAKRLSLGLDPLPQV